MTKKPRGGSALLKYMLLELQGADPRQREPHPKPLSHPLLPYRELRDPGTHSTRRETGERLKAQLRRSKFTS